MLNEVVEELGTPDRDALLLRFYEQRPFREIGDTLRLSEDAVQKRVERALEKMRAGLVRRGITSTAVALAVMLQNNAVAAAPVGLTGTITQGALAAAGVASGATAVFQLMSIAKIQLTVVAALVVAGVTTLTLQHRQSTRLGEEISALQRENQQLARSSAENKRVQTELTSLRAEHAENVRLRGELDALKAKPAAQTAGPASSPRPLDPMRSLEALHNVGNATPAAALESLIWAKENLDVATLSKLFSITPDVKKKLEAIFAEFPEAERTKHGISTPEEMLAFFFAGLAKPYSGLQIAEQHEIDSDNMAFRVVLQLRNGGTNKPDFLFHQSVDGGWQWVMPGGLIDELPSELKKLDSVKPDSK